MFQRKPRNCQQESERITHRMRKYLQVTYLIRDLYPEYRNSVVKRQVIQFLKWTEDLKNISPKKIQNYL